MLQNDARLVTTLVERWCLENNTFFHKTWEMTVTLEDVGYIPGLPITGRSIVENGIDCGMRFFSRN